MKTFEIKFRNCGECGSTNLGWELTGGCVDGRIRMHEVDVIAFLACRDCSGTAATFRGDALAEFLTELQSAAQKEVTA